MNHLWKWYNVPHNIHIKYNLISMTYCARAHTHTHTHTHTHGFLKKIPYGRSTGEGRIRISRCKLAYIGWIKKELLYSTGNYTQYPVINHNGKQYEK